MTEAKLDPTPEPAPTAAEPAPKRFQCRHIHTSGHRCGSPALRGGPFCYHHHTTRNPEPRHRGVHPEHAVFELPAIDDRPGIQFALAQVLARIATNQLDPKRSSQLLFGLLIASRNLPPHPRPNAAATRSDSRSSPSSRDSAAADNSNHPEDIVEELILDEDLGPIAPIAEIRPPEAPQTPPQPPRPDDRRIRPHHPHRRPLPHQPHPHHPPRRPRPRPTRPHGQAYHWPLTTRPPSSPPSKPSPKPPHPRTGCPIHARSLRMSGSLPRPSSLEPRAPRPV